MNVYDPLPMDLHLRPRMLLLTTAEPVAVRDVLAARLEAQAGVLEGRVTRTQLVAWIARQDRKLWSPCLELNCRPHPGGTLIVGRLGPHLFLYSMMVFCFIGTGLIAAISLCWGYVQWSLGNDPTALFGVIPVVVVATFFAALDTIGRRRARPQMITLAALVDGLGELQKDEAGVLREADAHRQRMGVER